MEKALPAMRNGASSWLDITVPLGMETAAVAAEPMETELWPLDVDAADPEEEKASLRFFAAAACCRFEAAARRASFKVACRAADKPAIRVLAL